MPAGGGRPGVAGNGRRRGSMSREILFKGKDFGGKWHEGNLAVLKEDVVIGGCTVKAGSYISNEYGLPFAYPVVPSTVGQYTGSVDDKKKRLFEGDLVSLAYDGDADVFEIVFDVLDAGFHGKNEDTTRYINCCEEIIKIGNTHDMESI